MDMRCVKWNARSLYRAGSLMAVAQEISEYKAELVGVQDRWDRCGTEPAGEYTYTFLWKGERESSIRESGE
jgi:hypothetical protein